MTRPTEPTWCECGRHLVDPYNHHHHLCPVCVDEAAKPPRVYGWTVGGAA